MNQSKNEAEKRQDSYAYKPGTGIEVELHDVLKVGIVVADIDSKHEIETMIDGEPYFMHQSQVRRYPVAAPTAEAGKMPENMQAVAELDFLRSKLPPGVFDALLSAGVAIYQYEEGGVSHAPEDEGKWFVSTSGDSPLNSVEATIPLADSEPEAWVLAANAFEKHLDLSAIGPLRLDVTSVTYAVELTVPEFLRLEAIDYLDVVEPKMKVAGADRIEYNGHFGPCVHFSSDPKDAAVVLGVISELVGRPLAEGRPNGEASAAVNSLVRTDVVAEFIKRCGDNLWSECEQFPKEDWRYAVSNDDTILGYWEWVYNEAASNNVDLDSLTGKVTT